MKHFFSSVAIVAATSSPAFANNYFNLKTDSKENLNLEALITQNYAGSGRLIKVGSKDTVTLSYAPNVEDQIQAGILEDKRIQCESKGEVLVKSWCEWHPAGTSTYMTYDFERRGISTWTGSSCGVSNVKDVLIGSKYHYGGGAGKGCIAYQGSR
ncbi:hypothetical protein QTV49_004769 [Vibrio vulnificus]|nr:hypothetical protein [Vibrio vulnificus]